MNKEEILKESGYDLIDLLDGKISAQEYKERDSKRYDRYSDTRLQETLTELDKAYSQLPHPDFRNALREALRIVGGGEINEKG